jgi:hypothetical protein
VEWIKIKNKIGSDADNKSLTLALGTHTGWNEGMEKDIPWYDKQRRVRVTICILNKIEFKSKTDIRDEKGHYVM